MGSLSWEEGRQDHSSRRRGGGLLNKHLGELRFLNLTEIPLKTSPVHTPFGLFFKGKILGARAPGDL
jgi:hypothetical protein